ncbi:hypothetical protein BFDFBN_BFDFBN_06040, partial [Dysosmobacter welbionis]
LGVELAQDHLLDNGERALGSPIHAQGGGHDEGDVDRHQRHHPHHHLGGAVGSRSLGGLAHADLAQQEAEHTGNDGNQNQSHRGQRDARGEAADSAPGRLDQVNPQEVVVDVHPAGMLCNEVGELAVNDVGNGDLLIAGAGHDLNAGAFNQTSGRIHYRQTGVLAAEVHEVDNGLPDDIVQGHQNGQGQKAPQAAAHGIEALFLV